MNTFWWLVGWIGYWAVAFGGFYGLCILVLLLVDDEAEELR